MPSLFVTYRRFSLAEDALYYTDLFTEYGIPYEVEDDSPPVDISFSGNILNNAIRIKLRPEDFAAADALLEKYLDESMPDALDDHYLNAFTEEELRAILRKPDEWSLEDAVLAQRLLKQRGRPVDEAQVLRWKEERLQALRQPEKASIWWFWFGYIGGVLLAWPGLVIGMYIYRFRRVLPNGERIYGFDAESRRKGKWLAVLGAAWLVFLGVFLVGLTTGQE